MATLGNMTVGARGAEAFGDWMLHWEVTIDHVDWVLFRIDEGIQKDGLRGALKYVGWNRMEVQKLPPDSASSGASWFEVYVHDWPYVRRAIDWLYYELGPAIAGVYRESFVETRDRDRAGDYPTNPGTHWKLDTLGARVAARFKMAKVTVDQARVARDTLHAAIQRPPWLRGIGITKDPKSDGAAVYLMVASELDTPDVRALIPSEIDGVPVVIEAVGVITPL